MTMTRLRHSYQDYGTGRNTHIEFETPFISSHDTFDHDVIFFPNYTIHRRHSQRTSIYKILVKLNPPTPSL
jgi:hypothetical protein